MSCIFSAGLAFGSRTVTPSVTLSAESENAVTVPLAGVLTALQVNLPIDVSQLKAFCWVCDAAVVISINDAHGGSPDQEVTIAANTPFSWVTGSGITNPLGQDVTDLYIAKAASGNHTLQLYTAQDATPGA